MKKNTLSKIIITLLSLTALAGISVYANNGNPMPKFFGGNDNNHQDGNSGRDNNESDGHDNNKNNSKLDFKIDSQCHYYNYDPQNLKAIPSGDLAGYVDVGCFSGGQQFGAWNEISADHLSKFFNFNNIKPGDRGEDTISFHVSGDDGCGEIAFENIQDNGNNCTEAETKSGDLDCKNKAPGTREKNGELGKALEFSLWLDQGCTPGFQGKSDPGEGDGIFNENDILLIDWKHIRDFSSALEIRKYLRQARNNSSNICNSSNPNGDGKNTKKGICAGLSLDGRILDGTVYYYGMAWRLPNETGNEVQSDSLGFDMSFQVKSNGMCSVCQSKDYDRDARCND